MGDQCQEPEVQPKSNQAYIENLIPNQPVTVEQQITSETADAPLAENGKNILDNQKCFAVKIADMEL